jgi:hypothetical protein
MKRYELWEMFRLTEKLRRGGDFFLVRLEDERVTGYSQHQRSPQRVLEIADLGQWPFDNRGNTAADVAWVDEHRDHFRILCPIQPERKHS